MSCTVELLKIIIDLHAVGTAASTDFFVDRHNEMSKFRRVVDAIGQLDRG